MSGEAQAAARSAPDALALPPLAALFAPCRDATGVALAVSGGSDSTALALLYRRWREEDPAAPPAVVLTVDHGLRVGSAQDAAAVERLADELELPCRVLRIESEPPRADVQAWARDQRYALLTRRARACGCDTLLTAHTLDDQAETLLLRLARGSGLVGLAAMRPLAERDGLRLVRPLLLVRREALRRTLVAARIAWREDPSNADDRFARARVRKLLPRLAAEGFTAPRLAATADRLRRAADAIDEWVGTLARDAVAADPGGFARIDEAALLAAPLEVRLRCLAGVLTWVGGARYGPRLERLEALEAALHAPGFRRRTLSGAIIERRRDALFVVREPGRGGLERLTLAPGETAVWDRRFMVSIDAATDAPLTVAPANRQALGGRPLGKNVPPRALAGMPALWREETCVAVPPLGLRHVPEIARHVTVRLAVRPPGQAEAPGSGSQEPPSGAAR